MDRDEKSMYKVLLERFNSLERSHQNLEQQFTALMHDKEEVDLEGSTSNGGININKRVTSDSDEVTSFPGWSSLSGSFCSGIVYRRVLELMGHAVYVTGSGEMIIYWNPAAEKLFGYKDYEVDGKRDVELLFEEEHQCSALAINKKLRSGGSWSGQLPLKKRSGQIFMALVTKTPYYEDDLHVGTVTVSSDAVVFNKTNSISTRAYRDQTDGQHNTSRINFKKIQWHPPPDLASSVSSLASKVLSRKQSKNAGENGEGEAAESQDVKADRPPRAPTAKLAFSFSIGKAKTEETKESTSEFPRPLKNVVRAFSKLQMGANGNSDKVVDENVPQNGNEDISMRKEVPCEKCYSRDSIESGASRMCYREADVVPNSKSVDGEDSSPRQFDSNKSGDSTSGSGRGSSPGRGDNDSNMVVDCEVRWEDLLLREEIGQGSFAVVYRGIWNGSDVAVKVYSGNQYSEGTLLEYKKEIDIMRRLRHPNVLLFMGAVCSGEKLGIVTEYLTRGSLFRTLHKNNQLLDIRRRLKMAIDVARGMNYLHHRNPPIVHRDLKSSNLLVDKSWTVKVGDFGLSKLKHGTFLTAMSGRGTPQWMSPEVLRNEPTTEKSDVYSFGVILWELMTESIPWSNLNSLQVVGVVGFMDRRLDIPENMNPRVSSIISDCWQSNPEHRPSFEDILHRMTDLVQSMTTGVMPRTTSTT